MLSAERRSSRLLHAWLSLGVILSFGDSILLRVPEAWGNWSELALPFRVGMTFGAGALRLFACLSGWAFLTMFVGLVGGLLLMLGGGITDAGRRAARAVLRRD